MNNQNNTNTITKLCYMCRTVENEFVNNEFIYPANAGVYNDIMNSYEYFLFYASSLTGANASLNQIRLCKLIGKPVQASDPNKLMAKFDCIAEFAGTSKDISNCRFIEVNESRYMTSNRSIDVSLDKFCGESSFDFLATAPVDFFRNNQRHTYICKENKLSELISILKFGDLVCLTDNNLNLLTFNIWVEDNAGNGTLVPYPSLNIALQGRQVKNLKDLAEYYQVWHTLDPDKKSAKSPKTRELERLISALEDQNVGYCEEKVNNQVNFYNLFLTKGVVEVPTEEEIQLAKTLSATMSTSVYDTPDEQEDIIEEEEEEYVLYKSEDLSYHLIPATNIIYSGVPGCGKSYKVDNVDFVDYNKTSVSLNEVPAESRYETARVVFYPDYTYSDFVGQVMPKTEDGKIKYEFVPGPFVRVLERALLCDILRKNEETTRNFVLIIEEINRGNAAAIFGDLFQLLDRDSTGRSKYDITNEQIYNYLTNKSQYKNIFKDSLVTPNMIYIPKNLSLAATMNTTDQNLYVLDSAFTRRWEREWVKNDFAKCEYRNYLIPLKNQDVTWEQFATTINSIVRRFSDFGNDDKELGAYFVKDECLLESRVDQDFGIKRKRFAHKVLGFIWADVLKFGNRKKVFVDNIKSIEELFEIFIDKGSDNIFSEQFVNEIGVSFEDTLEGVESN